jgi:hypothetical protein
MCLQVFEFCETVQLRWDGTSQCVVVHVSKVTSSSQRPLEFVSMRSVIKRKGKHMLTYKLSRLVMLPNSGGIDPDSLL